MIKIEIDGKELDAEKGQTIIEVADKVGIDIPRFCYHKKLSIAANCRMCLVEVKGAPKPMPACATPIAEGMKVETKSSVALLAQRAVMEFLLINHPLDCPICDQGGECELQDVSLGYGEGVSRYNQGKRSVQDENIGPLIATGMTRCIHCTRCVRFGSEVAGMKELGSLGRGEHTEIRTFINNTIDSELSGNLIDVCPVGALTSKPYRFSARAWELQQHASVAAHDPVGSNIYVHSLRDKIKRVVPRENDTVNEVWISDRDRFSYEALLHSERINQPMTRIDGELQPIEWDQALALTVEAIAAQVKENPHDLIALMSPNSTVEEGYLLQKLMRGLGANNIDHRLRTVHDFELGSHNTSLAELENADAILMIGAAPRKSMPLLNHRIRKAALKNSKILAINPVAFDWNYNVHCDHVVTAEQLVNETAAVLKQLLTLKNQSVPQSLAGINVSAAAQKIAEAAHSSNKLVIILGDLAVNHPDHQDLYQLFLNLKQLLNCGTIVLSQGANSQGLKLVGARPPMGSSAGQHAGHTINTAFDLPEDKGTYLLFNIEPELDCANGKAALEKLQHANKVICFSSFISETMANYADIVLPLAAFAETSGTFVNIDNQWQSFRAAINTANLPNNQVRPGWRIICALAHLLDVSKDEFLFASSLDVKQQALNFAKANAKSSSVFVSTSASAQLVADLKLNNSLLDAANRLSEKTKKPDVIATLVTEINCYQVDNIVRRANSLQATADALHSQNFYISQNIASKMQLRNGDSLIMASIEDINKIVTQVIIIDNRLPNDTVYMTSGNPGFIGKPYEQVVLFNSTEINNG